MPSLAWVVPGVAKSAKFQFMKKEYLLFSCHLKYTLPLHSWRDYISHDISSKRALFPCPLKYIRFSRCIRGVWKVAWIRAVSGLPFFTSDPFSSYFSLHFSRIFRRPTPRAEIGPHPERLQPEGKRRRLLRVRRRRQAHAQGDRVEPQCEYSYRVIRQFRRKD